MRKAERSQRTFEPSINDSTIKRAYEAGFVDINGHLTQQGEKLMNPEFGTIIWDAIHEPLTEDLKEAIAKNVSDIINSDPRVVAGTIECDSYESGILIDVDLTYLPYNISERLRLKFDEDAGQF